MPLTKSWQRKGAKEVVTVHDAWVGFYVALAGCGRARIDRLRELSTLAMRRWFDRACSQLGLSHSAFRPYSLRRGGATQDFLAHGQRERTLFRGRWGSLPVAKIYITDGIAMQIMNSLSVTEVAGLNSAAGGLPSS